MKLPKIFELPVATRTQLDEMLRAAGYGSSERLAAWLKSEGFQSSRSAVGRYALMLRARDAAHGHEAAALLQARLDERNAGIELRELAKTLSAEVDRLMRKQSEISREVGRLRLQLERLTATHVEQVGAVASRGRR